MYAGCAGTVQRNLLKFRISVQTDVPQGVKFNKVFVKMVLRPTGKMVLRLTGKLVMSNH